MMKLLCILCILLIVSLSFTLCRFPWHSLLERPSVYIIPVAQGGTHTQTLNQECRDVRGSRQSEYSQVGTLSTIGGDSTNDVLPLFAAKSCIHRDRYFYHTQTGAYEPIRLPVHYKNRNCMKDDIGCETVYDDDSVTIPILGGDKTYRVELYKDLY